MTQYYRFSRSIQRKQVLMVTENMFYKKKKKHAEKSLKLTQYLKVVSREKGTKFF